MCDRRTDPLQVQMLRCGEVKVKIDFLRFDWVCLYHCAQDKPYFSPTSSFCYIFSFSSHLPPDPSNISLFPCSLSHYPNSLTLPGTSRLKPALW